MSTGLTLITSGAYVGQELAAEFGHLPPAFLPVGTRRLYEFQLDSLGDDRPVYLTLPEHFTVPPHDLARLAERKVSLLFVPEGIGLGESIVHALNMIGGPDQPLQVLHGDTLLEGVSCIGADALALVFDGGGYSWAEVTLSGERITGLQTVEAGVASERRAPILCGFFTFEHSASLIRGITRARGDFIKGLLTYNAEHPLRAVEVGAWFDFGHLQTFFRSRRMVSSARSFNTLHIDDQVARKSSSDQTKMRAESNWFATVPPRVRLFSARLIDVGEEGGESFYETEYEYLPTLSELFVFGTQGRASWIKILEACRDFLISCAAATGSASADDALRHLVIAKTSERLRRYSVEAGFDVDQALFYDGQPMPSLMEIAGEVGRNLNLTSGRLECVMHGDFCFSNILYDSRVQRIHVIDPRGYVEAGASTIYGDLRYDLAKLSHSVTGRYDQIIAGRYSLTSTTGRDFVITFDPAPHQAWLEAAFDEMVVHGIPAGGSEVRAITISLFLSMLPLHADRPDRQIAFIANALRLYARWKELADDCYSDGREISAVR
jgi:hypothetical protein